MHDPDAPRVPLRDLALISDRRTGALITRDAQVLWYAPDRFEAPTLLAGLLDADQGGTWTLHADGLTPERRAYHADSAVLHTHLNGPHGPLTITDFLPYAPGTPRGLARLLSPAPTPLTLTLHAAPNYARTPAHPRLLTPHAAHLHGNLHLYASHPLRLDGPRVHQDVPAGERGWAFLATRPTAHMDGAQLNAWHDATVRAWAALGTTPDHGAYTAAVRAALRALRMLTDEDSGGVLAAPTFGLPEVPGGPANWDYRYVWLRDAGMIVSALTRLGAPREGERFLDFVCGHVPETRDLPRAPFTTASGQPVPTEQTLRLRGYAGSHPVRVGNDARQQLQLDAYGNVLLAAKLVYERTPDRPHWGVVRRLARFLADHWHEDDAGIWEERTPRPYVAGKVIAACALERIAPYSTDPHERATWQGAARAIRTWVATHGLTRDGAYAYVAGQDHVDITAALYPVWGYCAPDTPEMLATAEALERDRQRGHLYWRTIHDDAYQQQHEGAFLAGTFWMAQYWVMRDPARARTIIDAALRHASDLGLLAEEADPDSGALWGNYPQSFVHAALIGAVIDLRAAEARGAHPTPS
ncbi:glycoside hydrolase family 15 protein [Deinococcus maricopensis]|uniref:Glycoside hydrolase 15-related protein n=1 Tax=Deinococcus maricopensis (strain DSM 21211 / LMG 22137 / NRRL B-23946 / LB-34) TaxID=709986 RepID=E8U787_DEIML|nr:glycoside hydrolase family 15 protein [Deinococcus maricopensis]ADV66926.1 glycoside hydrolase 15-related protein [Deinococcus maricopensis DSM 21211]